MTRRKRHEATLRRRRDYLTAEIAVAEGRGVNRDYARAERGAITYALAVLEDADRIGIPGLGELTIEERTKIRAALALDEQAA